VCSAAFVLASSLFLAVAILLADKSLKIGKKEILSKPIKSAQR
jgi:hypothetical protein